MKFEKKSWKNIHKFWFWSKVNIGVSPFWKTVHFVSPYRLMRHGEWSILRLQNQHLGLRTALTIGGRFRRLRRTATDICGPLQTAPSSILAPRPNDVPILSSLQPGCTCIFIKSYQYCNILYFINVVTLCQNFIKMSASSVRRTKFSSGTPSALHESSVVSAPIPAAKGSLVGLGTS